jgi:hypothetical protein
MPIAAYTSEALLSIEKDEGMASSNTSIVPIMVTHALLFFLSYSSAKKLSIPLIWSSG